MRRWRPWLLVVGGLLAIRLCRGGDGAGHEATVHLKLGPGAGEAWRGALAELEIAERGPLFVRSAAALAADRAVAIARTGRPIADLRAWSRVRVRGEPDAIAGAVARLAARPDVVAAFVAPRVELAVLPADAGGPRLRDRGGASCPVRTPIYHERQGYLGPAPAGIDVAAARGLAGGRGDAAWFADIEYGWNRAHEDLGGERLVHVIGPPKVERGAEAHGTAVLGEVVARDNQLGMVGIAPDVPRVVTASAFRVATAAAIDAAQAELRPGDVLLIELHAIGPRGRYLPVEFWDDVFDAIQVATARGVVVVAAAGNGGEDLDRDTYRGKLDRRVRDSGAILVGAGAPAEAGFVDRSRLGFSNYGSRVDLQGWGRRVATFDYGDLQGCDAAARKYTAEFSGTSSASPIVAGAALLIESVARSSRGCPLDPRTLRALLAGTGSPQTDGPDGPAAQRIGPRPDLARALVALRATPPRCR